MSVLDRRKFLLASASAIVATSIGWKVEALQTRATLGAIRWDAWYIPSDVGPRLSMESTLGPSKWQGRAPSCAQVISKDKIDLGSCGNQARIDSEIRAAKAAGIDYWAYVWYGPDHDMQAAWRLHQASSIKNEMKWCIIFSGYWLFENETKNALQLYLGYFEKAEYHKVQGNRPLLFVLHDSTPVKELKSAIEAMRYACNGKNLGNPYIVLLVGASSAEITVVGADAIGIYSKADSAPVEGKYADLVRSTEAYWTRLAATGQQVVPTAMTGADRRPRVARPVPWEPFQKPNEGDKLYYRAGTPIQIAAHIKDMMDWIKSKPASCPAQTGLVYSWDEHDEGGSTLNPTLENGSAVLDAIGQVLSNRR